jgi:hypothetical protein
MTSAHTLLSSYTDVPVSSDPLFVATADANTNTTSTTGTSSPNHNATVLLFDQDDSTERTCRICLQDDEPHDLIAPCRCKGSSKWVHRQCLDQWRAVNRQDIAFSQCTECLFQYHLETADVSDDDNEGTTTVQCPKKLSYCLFVSRDLCCILTMIQMVIALLGVVVWLLAFYSSFSSSSKNVNEADGIINSNDNDDNGDTTAFVCTAMECQIVVSYLGGLCVLLVGLGMYGSLVFCAHECSITHSVNAISDHVLCDTPVSARSGDSAPHREACLMANTMNDRETNTVHGHAYHHQYNRRSRGRPRRRVALYCCCADDDVLCCCRTCQCLLDCCDTCRQCPWDYCCRRLSQHSLHSAAAGSNNSSADGSCCDCCGAVGSCTTSSDEDRVVLMSLAVVGIVLAIVGFILGSMIASMAIQRILQQHFWILQKQRLVQHFRVRDLSYVMEDDPMLLLEENGRQMEKGNLERQDAFGDRMTRPQLPEQDVNHLKKLKLL